jgi:putative tryptophan/tyrosine transport system substrate-binding protein
MTEVRGQKSEVSNSTALCTMLRALSFWCAMLYALCAIAEAQQPKKVPRIGYLSFASQPGLREEAFIQGLRDLGWVAGQSISIEYRWAAGNVDRLPTLAEELVRLKVDVIVAGATPVIQAAKNATSTIPIVMPSAADPVGMGLVASLARPGGNVTGMSAIMPELAGKRLELLREIVPKLSRVAFLAYGPGPGHRLFVKEAQDAAQSFRMRFQSLVLRGPEEIEGAFSAIAKEGSGALIIQPVLISPLGHGTRITELALKHRVPTVSDGFGFAETGGLMFYGPDTATMHRRAAIYVDKILKGAKPGDLPVEQPTKFELVINLNTAKQIGLTIPPNVLARADRVIK